MTKYTSGSANNIAGGSHQQPKKEFHLVHWFRKGLLLL